MLQRAVFVPLSKVLDSREFKCAIVPSQLYGSKNETFVSFFEPRNMIAFFFFLRPRVQSINR